MSLLMLCSSLPGASSSKKGYRTHLCNEDFTKSGHVGKRTGVLLYGLVHKWPIDKDSKNVFKKHSSDREPNEWRHLGSVH